MSLPRRNAFESEICAQPADHGWLSAEAQRAIHPIQVIRTALTSAAVIGQIDMRNLEPTFPA